MDWIELAVDHAQWLDVMSVLELRFISLQSESYKRLLAPEVLHCEARPIIVSATNVVGTRRHNWRAYLCVNIKSSFNIDLPRTGKWDKTICRCNFWIPVRILSPTYQGRCANVSILIADYVCICQQRLVSLWWRWSLLNKQNGDSRRAEWVVPVFFALPSPWLRCKKISSVVSGLWIALNKSLRAHFSRQYYLSASASVFQLAARDHL